MDKAFLRKHHLIIVCLALALAIVIVYFQVSRHEFIIFDDPEYVYENPHVQTGLTGRNIVWAFTSSHANNWHPLTWVSHMVDVQLFGLRPGGHHLVNVLFHIANTVLLFLILHRMTHALWRSAFVAALFALHPLHVESVAWVSERKDVLSTFFWMLTLGAYAFYVEKPGLKRYLLTLAFFALGLMAKPMLVTLPLVLLLLDYWPLGRFKTDQKVSPGQEKKKQKKQKSKGTDIAQKKKPALQSQWLLARNLLGEKIPFLGLALLSSILTIHAQQEIVKSLDQFPLDARLANAVVSYITYIGKMLWPLHLSIFYPHPGVMLPVWQIIGAVFLLIAVTVLTIRLKKPYLATGWFWYLGSLVPVIGIVQVGTQAYADRYTYIPFIGLFIGIAWGFADLLEEKRFNKTVTAGAAVALLAIFSLATWVQAGYWRNNILLFSHAVEVTDNNYWAHYNLGLCLIRQGETDKALGHFQEVLRIRPREHEAINNIGLILAKRGDLSGAVDYFSRSLEIRPDYARAYINLGTALTGMGKNEEAARRLNEALKIDPNNPDANYSLGSLLARTGRDAEAESHFLETLRINPNHAAAHNQLGILLARKGQPGQAIDHFRRALIIKPDFKAAQENLQILVNQRGEF